MVKRDSRRRRRRVLILALLLLIPTLLSDLPLFSKMGHRHGEGRGGSAPVAGGPSGGGKLALVSVEPGALGLSPSLGRGKRHWHAAFDTGDDDDGQHALLQDLVYTHDDQTRDDNTPLSDGGKDFSFGGDGGGHPGGGGGGAGGGGSFGP